MKKSTLAMAALGLLAATSFASQAQAAENKQLQCDERKFGTYRLHSNGCEDHGGETRPAKPEPGPYNS